jgi:nucleotide-binding universal stress UspA family protein
VARAAEIAAHHGAELILVHAATVPETPEVPASMQPTADAYVKRLRDELAAHRDQLGDVRAHLHGTGVEVSQLIVDRFADDALVEAATETGADLILTGARERSAAARWLLGSVAAKVVRAAPCSVLCARAGDPDRGFSRIVVGTDFSDGAAKALARAVDVAERDATITVVHAVELGAWAAPGRPGRQPGRRRGPAARRAGRRRGPPRRGGDRGLRRRAGDAAVPRRRRPPARRVARGRGRGRRRSDRDRRPRSTGPAPVAPRLGRRGHRQRCAVLGAGRTLRRGGDRDRGGGRDRDRGGGRDRDRGRGRDRDRGGDRGRGRDQCRSVRWLGDRNPPGF